MAKQTINPGTAPTGAGGDTFRSGSAKLQANDDEIYKYLGDGTNLNKLGTAAFKNIGTQAGNVMEVGAFGIGGANTIDTNPDTFKSRMMAGVYIPDVPGHNQVRAYINAAYSRDWVWQIRSAIPGHPEFRFFTGGVAWGTWFKFRTELNTTVDGNGFIKNASPIVQLFADKIELNDEAQQQNITFEKVGVGDYLIKGSTGFAQEGWYIETPKDANGNVLFSVIYTTLENGDISVKTYKKKFDLETASIVADLDNPVDITENRWIDLRLQELPQPEIEVTDDPEQ